VGKANFTACLYHDCHAGALSEFANRVWPADTSTNGGLDPADHAVSTQKKEESQKAPTFLFLKDEEILGHITTKSVRLLCNSRLSPANWVVGLMVLPEYRKGPVGPFLIKKVNETLELAMTLHVEDAALRIFKGVGWKHLGVIPQYVNLLHAYRLFSNVRIGQMAFLRRYSTVGSNWLERIVSHPLIRLLMALLSSLFCRSLSLGTALFRPSHGPGNVSEEEAFDVTYDALWERVGGKFDALVVRDRAYLEARYGKRMKHYRLLACRHKGDLLGYCILKIKHFDSDSRMGNTRMGTIIDCLFDPGDLRVLQALVAAAIKLFKRERVDIIFGTASHSQVQKLLSLNGFIKVPGNLNFAYHDRIDIIRKDLRLTSWHLMRGDSDADANF